MKTDETKTDNQEQKPKGEIAIYTAGGEAQLEVRLQEDTVWLTQAQMAELFDKDVRTISEHIKNVYDEKELERTSTIRKFRIVRIEGNRRVARALEHYNLDVIISVGYRIKSQRGTQFRIWANRILKDYLIKGYAVNEKSLLEQAQKLKELQQTISFIQNKAARPELEGQAEELLKLIDEYSQSLTLLYQYDEGKLTLSKGRKPGFALTYEECQKLIGELSVKLADKGEAGGLFGQEYGSKFNGTIAAIYQTFDGEDLYPSIEEKAANLLYLTIKDHPFADGNKRIGSLLFIYFLEQNNALFKESGERKISDTALVALALLVATSDPKEKDVMIKIITNLLRG